MENENAKHLKEKAVKKKVIKKKKKTQKTKKKFLLVIFFIFIIVVIAVIIGINRRNNNEESNSSDNSLKLYDTTLSEYVKETEDGTRLNTSTALNVDKKIGDLNVTDIQLTENGGITAFTAKVTNSTDKATSLKSIWVVFLDENGKELYKAKGVIKALDAYESTNLNVSMSSNYVTAYDVEFKE